MTDPRESADWKYLPLALALLLPVIMYHAWALQVIWNWYVPAMFGTGALVYSQAIAIWIGVRIIRGPGDYFIKPAAKCYLFATAPKIYRQDMIFDALRLPFAPLFGIGIAWLLKTIWPPVPF